jgi:hypothetical protein
VIPRDVFVSYSQPDRECAFELVAQLEASGVGVWVAPRDISPAADWAAEIIEAISAARIMILVFSSHCNTSPQVRREVERAVHKQVPILPFRIEHVLPAQSLEYFLSSQHWLDAFPAPREPYYARLIAHITGVLGGVADSRIPAAGTMAASAPNAPLSGQVRVVHATLTASELESLERQLAYHVGPVARLLVQRAAARAVSREELMLLLAAEMDSTTVRQQFIAACRAAAATT